MQKDAAITVRISIALKRRLAARARQNRRSLSAQIATYLEQGVEREPSPGSGVSGKLLGLYAGTMIPTDQDFADVRRRLWGSLGKRRGRHER